MKNIFLKPSSANPGAKAINPPFLKRACFPGATLGLIILPALLVLSCWPAPTWPAEQTVVLRFNQFTSRTHWYHYKILEPWVADIENVTEGRVQVKFTTAPLGPFHRNFDIANVGIADMAAGNHSASPGRFPLTQIQQTPFLASERAEAASVALWRVYRKYLKTADEHGDTHVLALHVGGAGHMFSLSKPLDRVDDLKGMKMFAGGLKNARVLEKLGVVPVHRSMAEAYDLLSRGVVDGGLLPYAGLTSWHLLEFVAHQVIFPGGILPGSFFIVVNKKSWSAISAEDQAAIMKVSGERYAERAGSVFDKEAEKALDMICESTVRLSVASPGLIDRFAAAASFIDEEWIRKADRAGIDGRAALRYFRAQVEAYMTGNQLSAVVEPKCLEFPR